jgi:Primase C terminal 1 (PriCT-1)
MGIFADWQPKYAKFGVATFPVEITADNKKPSISGYLKTGIRGSAQLALKFAEAQSFGFACGSRNRLTIVDMDDTDPAIIDEGERLFGCSPLLWRTGGGKFAMPFRYNGEGRRIRPLRSIPIDLLGGGFAVAPPSVGAIRGYEIIRGTLADLDRLPVARIPDEIGRLLGTRGPAERIPEGKRNDGLFKHCRSIVSCCDDLDQLIDAAKTWAEDRLASPLPAAEIVKTCRSVWNYRVGRRKMMHCVVEYPEYQVLAAKREMLGVFAFLVAENGPDSEFMIADGLTDAMGWPRRIVPAARKMLLQLGLIECVRRPYPNVPGLYRWRQPA